MNKKVKKFFAEHVELHVLGVTLLTALVFLVCLFLVVKTFNEARKAEFIGRDTPAANILPVTGKGEVKAAPDVATFTATSMGEAKTSEDAQNEAADINNKIINYLTSVGVDQNDIQSTDISVLPKYSYVQATCTKNVCPPGKQVIDGYTANETLTIKVRDLNIAGDVVAGLTSAGASNVTGPNLTIDDPATLQKKARDLAIEDAQRQASEIAAKLGVRLGKVVSFSENANTPYPMDNMMYSSAKAAAPVAPQIATGENTVRSEVTVTFEIR